MAEDDHARPSYLATKGDDYKNSGETHHTYGITVSNVWQDFRREWQPHGNIIEVYREEALRDRVLHLLQTYGVTEQPSPEIQFRKALELITQLDPRSASAIVARAALAGRPF